MTCRTRTSIMPPGDFIRHLRKARCGGVLAFRAILSVRLIMNVHREPVMTRKATEQLQPKCVTERSGDKGAHEHARVILGAWLVMPAYMHVRACARAHTKRGSA